MRTVRVTSVDISGSGDICRLSVARCLREVLATLNAWIYECKAIAILAKLEVFCVELLLHNTVTGIARIKGESFKFMNRWNFFGSIVHEQNPIVALSKLKLLSHSAHFERALSLLCSKQWNALCVIRCEDLEYFTVLQHITINSRLRHERSLFNPQKEWRNIATRWNWKAAFKY